MNIYYDLHMHSGLSPCGDKDMTPNNIVGMATIKELDCIAVTDHNTSRNVPAVIEAAKSINPEMIVVPGIETETSEEIHTVCLFPTLSILIEFDEYITAHLPPIKNRPDVFGEQIIFDELDNPIGTLDNLLITATSIDLYKMVNIVKSYGGICIPSHIDRPSYSILASLGFIPPDLPINIVELSKKVDPVKYLFDNKKLFMRKYPFLQSSDAHYLEDIAEKERYIIIPDGKRTAESVIEALRFV